MSTLPRWRDRSLGWTRLGVIIWTSLASSVYFSLAIVAGHALGLTPLVFLAAGLFFALTALTYLEGASMHPERAGSTVFARYAFNELVSFIAGAAVLLDYVILVAICALTATEYLAAFIPALGHGAPRLILSLGIIVYVVVSNIFASPTLPALNSVDPRDDRGRRHRDPTRRGRDPRPRAVLQRVDDHGPDPPRQRADLERRDLRADDHDRRVHEPRVGGGALRRDRRQPRRRAAHRVGGAPHDHRDLRRHGGRRGHRGAGRRRPLGARHRSPRRPGDQHRRALPSRRARKRVQVRRRGGRRRDPDRGRQRRDARPVEARVLARDQSPDPERPRPPASAARDAVRADRHRRQDRRRGAGDSRRSRVPRRDLRVRSDARVHHRASVDLRVALPRAGPPAPLPRPGRRSPGARRPAAARRARRAALGRRLDHRDRAARRRALRGARVDSRRESAPSTWSTGRARASRSRLA